MSHGDRVPSVTAAGVLAACRRLHLLFLWPTDECRRYKLKIRVLDVYTAALCRRCCRPHPIHRHLRRHREDEIRQTRPARQ